MKLFYSGSSLVPENNLTKPDIMLSYWTNISKKTNKPDKILRTALELSRKNQGIGRRRRAPVEQGNKNASDYEEA